MRTVFQLQGAIDADRLNRELDELEDAAARLAARATASPSDDIEVIRALDCRYVGQGYELRVTLDGGRSTTQALERVPPPARARVRQRLRRPDRDRQRARHRDRQAADARRAARRERQRSSEALVGESEGHFRVDGDAAGAADALLRPRAAAARRDVRGPGRRLPSRHDDRRPARLDAPAPIAPAT